MPQSIQEQKARIQALEGRICSKHLCKAQCSGINAYVLGQMQSTYLDENVSYNVYVHLNQRSGDLIYSKCSCKAGQGGCCKHVAALLFSLVDYSNLGYTVVPDTLTCTQVSQKWHVPTSTTMILSKAVKLDEVVF